VGKSEDKKKTKKRKEWKREITDQGFSKGGNFIKRFKEKEWGLKG